MDLIQVVWNQILSLIEKELDAVGNRDLGLMKALGERKQVLLSALTGDLTQNSEIAWVLIGSTGERLRELSQDDRNPVVYAELVTELSQWQQLISANKAVVSPPAATPDVRRIAPNFSIVKEADAPKPPTGRATVASRRVQTNGGSKALLRSEDVRILTELLFGQHPTIAAVCQILWPAEYKADDERNNTLRMRIHYAKKRSLDVIRKVFAHPEMEEQASAEQQAFFQRVRAEFGTFERFEASTQRPKGRTPLTGRRSSTPTSNKVSQGEAPRAPAFSFSDPVRAGFTSKDHVKVIRASLLEAEPTLNLTELQSRTGLIIGGLRPILTGALRRLDEVMALHDQGQLLTEEAESIVTEIKQRWPNQELAEIIRDLTQAMQASPA